MLIHIRLEREREREKGVNKEYGGVLSRIIPYSTQNSENSLEKYSPPRS
jgi:hypothetical protein